MTATKHPLDAVLPQLEPERATILASAAILEVQDMAQLLELGRDPKMGKVSARSALRHGGTRRSRRRAGAPQGAPRSGAHSPHR